VSTTKLTRKEILAEDPVHHAIIQVMEFFRERGKIIAIVAAAAVAVGVGIYFGLRFLESRDLRSQQELAKAMSFYHAQIDPAALDDPFGKGPDPKFRTDTARYEAASKEFSALTARHGSSKVGLIARYYLGLCQLKLGQKDAGLQSLETVRGNTKDLTLGYLAKKVLARYYTDSGNYKAAHEILEGMIKDPQCRLPKDDLRLELSRVYSAQGKRAEALKVLREARDEAGTSALQSLVLQELTRLEGGSAPVRP
jgi:predicted negative regulator of RcsB-dependent stress response